MEAVAGTPEYHSKSERPLRETLILGVAFLCVFTSFQALQNLQSSLNQEQGLGVTSLACVYGAIVAVSVVTPAVVYHLGVRCTILLAWVGHLLYVGCNFYPRWGVLLPGSLLLGAVSCPLWTSLNTYMSALSRVAVEQDLRRSPKVVTTVHAAFSRINGIFHGVFSASQLTGNLLSSTILFQSSYRDGEPVASSSSSSQQSSLTSSSSVRASSVTSDSECGAGYCHLSGKGKGLVLPEPNIVYILLGVFLVLDAVGLVVTWRFVPDLQQPRYTGREVLRKLRSFWQVFFQPKFWLLIPFFFARGAIFSLHIGLYTEAYVSCALGIRMVGYVMSVWGLCTLSSSALLGCAARYTGRRFLFAFAFLLDAAILGILLLWRPHAGSTPVFFCLSALMGLVDGIWSVQGSALIVVLFPAVVDSAFSASGTWGSLAMSSSFVMAKFLCPSGRILVALGLLGVALLGYVGVEVAHWRSLKTFGRDEQEYMLVRNSGLGMEEESGTGGHEEEGEEEEEEEERVLKEEEEEEEGERGLEEEEEV